MTRCIVDGCLNPVVRQWLLVQMHGCAVTGVCAFHGQAIIRHGTDEQVRMYVFPTREAAEAESDRRLHPIGDDCRE